MPRIPLSSEYDLHLHSKFSPDSEESMRRHCDRALLRGFAGVCFTDHMDFNGRGLDYFNADAYFRALRRVKAEYKGLLDVLAGIEISEPHLHRRELEWVNTAPFDFVLGSVHYFMGGLFPAQMRESGMDTRKCFEVYWQNVLDMTALGGFDACAHLDFPKRYFLENHWDASLIREICANMRKNNLVMEINSSWLRKGGDELLPDDGILDIYKQEGGEYVTLGSDAHSAKSVGADLETAAQKRDEKDLCACFFRARTRIPFPQTPAE
jgi:histidinol-phosphatase (PHP family)